MSFTVLKPFLSSETKQMTKVGSTFRSGNEQYLKDLQRNGLIGEKPAAKARLSAPSNKDAAPQRKDK